MLRNLMSNGDEENLNFARINITLQKAKGVMKNLDLISIKENDEYERLRNKNFGIGKRVKLRLANGLLQVTSICMLPLLYFALHISSPPKFKRHDFGMRIWIFVVALQSMLSNLYLHTYLCQTAELETFMLRVSKQHFDLRFWFMAEGSHYRNPKVRKVCRETLTTLMSQKLHKITYPLHDEHISCLLSLIDLNNLEEIELSLNVLMYSANIRHLLVASKITYLAEFQPRTETQNLIHERAAFALAKYKSMTKQK